MIVTVSPKKKISQSCFLEVVKGNLIPSHDWQQSVRSAAIRDATFEYCQYDNEIQAFMKTVS